MKPELELQFRNLIDEVIKRQKEICEDNNCTEDVHICESCLYIRLIYDGPTDDIKSELIDYQYLSIERSDYFQGASERENCELVSIPLPIDENITVLEFISLLEQHI